MTSKKNQYDDDDGRVICNMDVEGMRWAGKSDRRKSNEQTNTPLGDQLTRSEARRFTWNAILAGLLVATVFSVTWILFILFCTEIWFR